MQITKKDIETLEKKAEETHMPRPFTMKINASTWCTVDEEALLYIDDSIRQGKLKIELCNDAPNGNFYMQSGVNSWSEK